MTPSGAKPFYTMAEVLACVDAAPQRLQFRPEALEDAARYYGYGREDVAEVLRALSPRQCHKPLKLAAFPGEVADVYRVGLPDGAVEAYVKFYIDGDNILQVLSFKPWSP